jgi:hypothetical protein
LEISDDPQYQIPPSRRRACCSCSRCCFHCRCPIFPQKCSRRSSCPPKTGKFSFPGEHIH